MRSDAESNYQALQLGLQRRLSRGLQTLVSYTWSHAIDSISYDAVTDAPSRASSDFDIRHNFKGSVTFDLPSPGWNSVAKAVLGGWGTDLIVSMQSATPLTLNAGQTTIGGELVTIRPDVVAGVPWYVDDPAVAGGRRVNKLAFRAPAAGTQGTSGRNALRALAVGQADLAVRRKFKLTESLALQFRAEAFNLFNQPNFGAYNTTYNNADVGVPSMTLNKVMGGGVNSLYQIGGSRSLQFALRLSF